MPDQFYSLTWNQYQTKLRGYIHKTEKEKEVIRWAVWMVMSPHVKKMPPMEKILPLSIDRIETPEQMAKRLKERLKRAGREFNDG